MVVKQRLIVKIRQISVICVPFFIHEQQSTINEQLYLLGKMVQKIKMPFL